VAAIETALQAGRYTGRQGCRDITLELIRVLIPRVSAAITAAVIAAA
jgi:hypothetical protein